MEYTAIRCVLDVINMEEDDFDLDMRKKGTRHLESIFGNRKDKVRSKKPTVSQWQYSTFRHNETVYKKYCKLDPPTRAKHKPFSDEVLTTIVKGTLGCACSLVCKTMPFEYPCVAI